MIAVASLQFRAGKSLAGKRASERAAGLLSSCAKWRHRCEQKYWEQLAHVTVLEQSRRFVQSDSRHCTMRTEALKLIKLLKQLPCLDVWDTSLKAGVNEIDRVSVVGWPRLDSCAD